MTRRFKRPTRPSLLSPLPLNYTSSSLLLAHFSTLATEEIQVILFCNLTTWPLGPISSTMLQTILQDYGPTTFKKARAIPILKITCSGTLRHQQLQTGITSFFLKNLLSLINCLSTAPTSKVPTSPAFKWHIPQRLPFWLSLRNYIMLDHTRHTSVHPLGIHGAVWQWSLPGRSFISGDSLLVSHMAQ